MAAPVVPSLIVNELLNKHNSGDWRVRVKTYLVAKGLWSVVSEATEPRLKAKDKLEAWKKTNAEALHAIHLCCGNDAFKVIRDEESAHKAWKALIFHYPGDDHTSNNGNTEKAKEVVEDAETEKEAIEGDDHTSYIGNTEITTEVVKGAETEKKAIEGDDHTSNDGNTKIEKEVVGDAETEKEAIEGDDHTSNEGNIEIAKEVVEDAETGTEAIEGDDHISNKGNIEIAKEVVEDAETGKEAIEGDDHTSNDGNTDIAKEVVEDAETEKEAIEGDGGGDENSSNDDNKYNPFFNALKHLKWNSVMAFLKQYPEAISKAAPSSDDGKTVLHYAVDAGKVDIVESLLTFVKKDDDLEIMDNKGYSALDYCYMVPEKDETVEIAKRLLHKKAKLLKREVDPEVILSLFVGAHLCRRQKLADYLYKDTPLGPDDPLAAHLVSLSFSTKRFGNIEF